MVSSTVCRSSVEFTACETSPSARNSPTERPRSSVRAEFVEQTYVFYGDDRLCGEIRHQSDLLVGKRTGLLARQSDCADQLAFFQHRDGQEGPNARDFDAFDGNWFSLYIALRCHDIGISIAVSFGHLTHGIFRTGAKWRSPSRLGKGRRRIE